MLYPWATWYAVIQVHLSTLCSCVCSCAVTRVFCSNWLELLPYIMPLLLFFWISTLHCRTFMLKLSRRGVAPPRSHTHGQLLVLHWKLSKRRGVRNLKSVMQPEKRLSVRSRSASRKPRMRKRQRRQRWQNLRRHSRRVVLPRGVLKVLRLAAVVGSAESLLHYRESSSGLAFSPAIS